MSLQNLEMSRIVRAVALVFGIGIVLYFMVSFATLVFWPSSAFDRVADLWDMTMDPDTEPQALQNEVEDFSADYSSEINAQYVIMWSLTALITFWMARRVARGADSVPQAVGYGVATGVGVAMSYGVLCVICSIAMLGIRLLFLILLVAAGWFGGQLGGQNLSPVPAERPRRSPAAPGQSALRGANPDVYYNMGVAAALGGRREEARQHFTRVLQMQPRNLNAWLQLANLSDTPEQAWNYVQQARAINAADPAVLEAVNVIWPQVAANAQKLPQAQPPYREAVPNDTAIPRITPPDVSESPADPGLPPPESPADSGDLPADENTPPV